MLPLFDRKVYRCTRNHFPLWIAPFSGSEAALGHIDNASNRILINAKQELQLGLKGTSLVLQESGH